MMNTNQSTPVRTVHRTRVGGTLVSVVGVMLVVGVLGGSVISLTHSSEHSHLSANAGSRAYYLAESGLRYAQQVYAAEGWLHGRERTLTLLGGVEQVEIIRIGDTFWATAFVGAGTAQEARALVPMPLGPLQEDPEVAPVEEFAVFGDMGISLGQNTVIAGDVAITDDDIDIRGDVEGSVLANDVALTGHGTVTGDIYSSGEVDVTSGTVTGDIHAATGISVDSAQSTVEGWLFSNGPVDIGGGATVLGSIHSCGSYVDISGNGTVLGTPEEPIEIRADGDVYLGGTAEIYGVVYAGGTIVMTGNARIHGDAYAAGAITIGNNNWIDGTALQFSPTYLEKPICPYLANLEGLELPDASEFTAGGPDISVPLGTESNPTHNPVSPGVHGALTSPDNTDGFTNLYLNAGAMDHGYYYFDSVSLGDDTALYLNLSGTYDIRIFVVGNITVGDNLNVLISTDGVTYLPIKDPLIDPQTAARVYWESHSEFDLGAASNWFGSVYTPSGNLQVRNGSYLIGSYYSRGGHDIIASTVVHVAPNYFAED